jgi:CRISPR-associated protein Cas1
MSVPVETKHGKPARGASPLWPPELAQVTAQALLLREHGHEVPYAEVFFAGSNARRRVELPPDGEEWVTRLVAEIRANAARTVPPPALVDSPKCPRCSLVGVCLLDEINLLGARSDAPPRRLVASDHPREPLYVIGPNAVVRKRRERLVLEVDGEERGSRRPLDVPHVAVFGNAVLTAAALRSCIEADTPILWVTTSGWFTAMTVADGGWWVARRIGQVERARSDAAVLVARAFIAGKIRNQRTLLRRNHPDGPDAPVLGQLAGLAARADDAGRLDELLGLEGTAARLYFGAFTGLLPHGSVGFEFEARNRRPPRTP